MSSRRLDLTDAAERDIRGILRFSRGRWGPERGETYGRRLADALQRLQLFPERGRRADRFAPGLRAHTVGQHVVYYLVNDEAVTIVRVLHERMDAEAVFDGDPW
jgi:toxin ParE1/3/4